MNLAAAASRIGGLFARLSSIAATAAPPVAAEPDLLKFVRERFSDDVRRNFGEARTPYLEQWPALRWRVGMPLILTRTLMRAAIASVEKAEYAGKGRIAFGMSGEPKYWRFHNEGTKRIPRREFYGPRQSTLKELMALVVESLAYEIVHKTAEGK